LTQLFTCSYRAWRPELGAPVVASLLVPKWIPEAKDWPRLWAATPRWSYFKAEPGDFDLEFAAQLERYGPERIARRLAEIARECDAENLVVLCWEVSAEQCHRSAWAAWWTTRTGEVVSEIEIA
jgi:hypothetical protein